VKKSNRFRIKTFGYIKGYADAAQEPKLFTTSPAKAMPKALEQE
jgi:acetyl-CoA C-acetyltransferase